MRLKTGELLDNSTGEIRRRDRKPKYFMVMTGGCLKLAEMNMGKNEYCILFLLLGRIGFNNLLFVNKTVLAKEFECDRVMLSKTISSLEEKGLLIRTKKGYRFNKEFFVCGESRCQG